MTNVTMLDYPELDAELKLYQVGMYTHEEYVDVLNYHLFECEEQNQKTGVILSELERVLVSIQ